jgi:glycosyltransferase involved in cell wall biosynthesis
LKLDLNSKKQLIFVYPGDFNSPTGGYAYDRKIIAGLKGLGWQIQLISLGDGYPFLNQSQKAYARSILQNLPAGVLIVMDGLALGVLPELVAEVAKRHPLLGLIHHPLALESGLTDSEKKDFQHSEIQALRHVVGVVATSPATARILHQEYEMDLSKIHVVLPGTELKLSSATQKDLQRDVRSVNLLSVGSIIPRKGFHDLIPALEPVKHLAWTLSIVGDSSRHAQAHQRLIADIEYFQLHERVKVLGVVSDQELEALYTQADIFVLASLFEGYGMVYAEAMAHGLPIIGTTGGAITDTVPSDAGVLVKPGDIGGLTTALKTLISDTAYRQKLAQGAIQAARRLPTWEESTENFAKALNALFLS